MLLQVWLFSNFSEALKINQIMETNTPSDPKMWTISTQVHWKIRFAKVMLNCTYTNDKGLFPKIIKKTLKSNF